MTAPRPRVFNLGLPKSGTTTLARALRRAGLHTLDYRVRSRQTGNTDLHGAYLADLLYEGYFKTGDPLHHLAEFEGFTEVSMLRDGKSLWPQMDWGLLFAIRQRHPDVKFLLSWRDPKTLSQSMQNWNNLGSTRLPNNAIPGLPVGYGRMPQHRIRWIRGHYMHIRHVFDGDPNFLEYKLDDPDAPKKIGKFIGRDLPWWGRTNVNHSSPNATPKETA